MTGIAIGGAFVAGVAFGAPAVVLVVAFGLALVLTGKAHLVWCAIALVAAVGGALRAPPAPSTLSPNWVDEATTVRGTVVSGPMTTGRGQGFNLQVSEVRTGRDWSQVSAIVCVSAADLPELRRGDRVYLVATGERLSDLPNGIGRALASRGCSASFTAWQTTKVDLGDGWRHLLDGVRREIADGLQGASPGDSGALLAGLVTGDDGALSSDRQQAFIATGTTHITAVSGGNLALIVVSAVTLGGFLGVQRRLFWQAVTVGCVWFYALLVGLEAPALRAAMVATGAVFAARFGRRADLVTLTVLAAAIQLIYRPEDYWSLSFRLSFASALALTLVLRGMGGRGAAATTRSMFVGTAAAQIAAAPVLISTFGALSPVSLPANLAIAPFVTLAFPLAVISGLVGLASDDLGSAVAAPAAMCASGIEQLVDGFSGVQGEQMRTGSMGLVVDALVPIASIAAVASLSLDCRRAVRRAWRQVRGYPTRVLLISGCSCLGFAIGLVVGAAR